MKVPYISPALKTGDKWVTSMRHPKSDEPMVRHAVENRHALFFVTRNAKVTLRYQIETVWHSTNTTLEIVMSSDELLTHAAMGEENDNLLLVTHDLSRRFRLYKIYINWNPRQHPRPEGQPPLLVVQPTLDVTHLTTLDHITAQHADTARLSQLRIVPAIPNVVAETSTTLPTIFAIFTRASLPADPIQQPQEMFSVIARWHVESITPTLHEAFSKLKMNGTTPQQSAVTTLRRQEDNITNNIVMSVDPQYYNTMLAFSASDGTIEFRDRVTMTSIEPYGDTTTISSLPQAGFEQMMGDHNADVAMSADGSAAVHLDPDGVLTHKLMSLRYSWQPGEDEITRGLIEAAVVCLARQYAILCCASTANDENLALLPQNLSTEMRSLFIREILKMTNRNLDISMLDMNKQQILTIREPLLPRALSAQFVIGYEPGTMEQTWAGRYAYTFLNMKMICTAFAQLFGKPDVFLRTDILASLRGLVMWASDLLVYVADALISIRRRVDATTSTGSAKEIFGSFVAEQNSPAVHLLLSLFSRAYLRFLASCIPKYLVAVQKIRPSAHSLTEKQQLTEILDKCTSLPLKYTQFEAFIVDFDTAVRNALTQVPPNRRSEIELASMCDLTISPELQSALQTLLDTTIPKFINTVDLEKSYFYDTSWLGIIPCKKAQQYDIIRKLPLTKDATLRVCRRCGGVMEDIPQEKLRELPAWFAHAQRHCVCNNYWILE